jgi:protoporphyrinogen/coproporphyrinogen III oxidase
MAIVVVGGGISGLALGHTLKRRGADVRVLESEQRPGGNLRTFQQSGFLLEAGPNGFLDREPRMRELLGELQLTDSVRRADTGAKRRFLFTRGALRELPSSPKAFLGSSVLPLGARLRVMLEPLSGRGRPGVDESLAAFCRRHVGKTATEVLADALQTGIYAGDPEALSVEAAFPQLVELEREHRSLMLGLARKAKAGERPAGGGLCTFEKGMQALPQALAEALGPSLQLGARVRSVQRGTPWRVELQSGELIPADQVVLALPTFAASPLVRSWDAQLADELDRITYVPVAVVHLGFSSEALPAPLEGFGFLVPRVEPLAVMGVIYTSAVFPWRAPPGKTLVSCMMAGARNPGQVKQSDEELIRVARSALERALGVVAQPVLKEVVRWPRAIPQYDVGHRWRVEELEGLCRKHPGLWLLGNAYRGVGVNDCVRQATVLADQLLPPLTP